MNTENQKRIESWKERIKEFKEVELFLVIREISGMQCREKNDFSSGRIDITEEEFNENQNYFSAMQKECLEMLKPFGVNPEDVSNDEGTYRKWYQHWKDWSNTFTKTEWEKFNKEDSDLLPKKKWNE